MSEPVWRRYEYGLTSDHVRMGSARRRGRRSARRTKGSGRSSRPCRLTSAALPSLDMRNFVGELAKTQSELHAARRERQRLAAIVAQFSDTKSAAELARCESVIDAAQKRFKTLDEALKKTELASQPETMLVENARERIAELQGEAEELVQEIERLRTDNVMLRETNCKLLSEREELVLSAHSVPSKHHYSEHGLRPQASQSVLMRSGESADKEEYDPAGTRAQSESDSRGGGCGGDSGVRASKFAGRP